MLDERWLVRKLSTPCSLLTATSASSEGRVAFTGYNLSGVNAITIVTWGKQKKEICREYIVVHSTVYNLVTADLDSGHDFSVIQKNCEQSKYCYHRHFYGIVNKICYNETSDILTVTNGSNNKGMLVISQGSVSTRTGW